MLNSEEIRLLLLLIWVHSCSDSEPRDNRLTCGLRELSVTWCLSDIVMC